MPNIFNEIEIEEPIAKQSLFPDNIMKKILETTCVMKKIRGDNTIEGDCTVDVVESINSNNGIVITNSNLYVSGEVTVKNNFEIKDSVVYVNGNFRASHGFSVQIDII